MENHYHLVVEAPEGNLSQRMRHINGVDTRDFNRCGSPLVVFRPVVWFLTKASSIC
ncbi:MAG: hypothetical protein GTO12_14350 [Proteobacteria bacterium]|nr:hypothetical protein [Pseudomonadota bacterium]